MKQNSLWRQGTQVLSFKLLASLLALIFHYLLAKQLSALEYGLFTLATSCLIFSTALAKQGLEQAIVRFFAQRQNEQSGGLYFFVVAYSGICSGIIGSIIYFLAQPLATNVLNKSVLIELLPIVAGLTVLQTWLAVNSSVLRGKGYPSLSIVFTGLITFSIVLLLFYWQPPGNALAALQQLAMGIIISCLLSFVIVVFKVSPKTQFKKSDYLPILQANKPLFVIALASVITQQSSVLLLARYVSLEQIAFFSLAIKVTLLMSYPLLAMNAITSPQYARLYHQGKIQACKQLATKSARLLMGVGTLGCLILLIFASDITSIFGEPYEEAVVFIRILALGQWINLATGSVVSILLMSGHEKLHKRNTLLITGINLFLLLFLIPLFGAVAAAWITTTTMIAKNMLSWYYVKILVFNKAEGCDDLKI